MPLWGAYIGLLQVEWVHRVLFGSEPVQEGAHLVALLCGLACGSVTTAVFMSGIFRKMRQGAWTALLGGCVIVDSIAAFVGFYCWTNLGHPVMTPSFIITRSIPECGFAVVWSLSLTAWGLHCIVYRKSLKFSATAERTEQHG
jgi:hypothetical protein